MTKRVQTLLDALEINPPHPLWPDLSGWCAGSKAFLTFAEANATKIRRKVRQAGTEDTRRDLLIPIAVESVRFNPSGTSSKRYGLRGMEEHGAFFAECSGI